MIFIEYLKELSDKKYVRILLFVSLASLITYNFDYLRLEMLFVIYNYPFSIIAVFIIIFVFWMIKFSDTVSNEAAKNNLDSYYMPVRLSTNKFENIFFYISDNRRVKRGNHFDNEILFYIVNKNIKRSVNKIKGRISLYTESHEVFSKLLLCYEFEIIAIKCNVEAIIKDLNSGRSNKDEIAYIEVRIDSLSFDDNSEFTEIDLKSEYIIHNSLWLYNHYIKMKDYKLLFFRTKYNLVWIKDKINCIRIYIEYQCSRKIYIHSKFFDRTTINELLKDFIGRWSFRFIFFIVVTAIFVITFYAFIDLLNVIYHFLFQIGSYLNEHINN